MEEGEEVSGDKETRVNRGLDSYLHSIPTGVQILVQVVVLLFHLVLVLFFFYCLYFYSFFPGRKRKKKSSLIGCPSFPPLFFSFSFYFSRSTSTRSSSSKCNEDIPRLRARALCGILEIHNLVLVNGAWDHFRFITEFVPTWKLACQ